jgi:uncharacterized membrane protein YccC
MTLTTEARLAMDLLYSASNAVVALVLLKETGWRSLVPALMMGMLVWRVERVESPQPALFAVAIAACLVVLLARGPGLHSLRVGAVVVCSLSSATLQVVDRLSAT